MEFIGRKHELEVLSQLLKKKIAHLVVIRGRRRIGKSRLAEQFGKNFPKTLLFSGLSPEKRITAQMQRDDFASQMTSNLDIAKPKSTDWSDLFRTLARFTQKEKLLIVFDEISWMGGKDPAFLGKLKTAWDLYFKKNPRLILILSGSTSSWIEQNILSSSGFIGRISIDLILQPLPLFDCNLFWGPKKENISAYEKFKVLSVTGGIPRYLEEIIPSLSAEENIRQLCFQTEGLLYREFENIFSDLFSKRYTIYRKIVNYLIKGPSSAKDICSFLDIKKTGTISSYLKDLVTAGFISRDYTWDIKTKKKSKLSQYRLRDNYTRFFLKYIDPNKPRIESGAFKMLPTWESIMGLQFENLVLNCRQTLWKLLNLDPMEIIYENPFFQKASKLCKGCQIDYLIQTRYGILYVCEIKFSQQPQGLEVVEEIKEKINKLQIPKHHSIRPVLIHVNGVKDSVLETEFFANIIDFGNLLEAEN